MIRGRGADEFTRDAHETDGMYESETVQCILQCLGYDMLRVGSIRMLWFYGGDAVGALIQKPGHYLSARTTIVAGFAQDLVALDSLPAGQGTKKVCAWGRLSEKELAKIEGTSRDHKWIVFSREKFLHEQTIFAEKAAALIRKNETQGISPRLPRFVQRELIRQCNGRPQEMTRILTPGGLYRFVETETWRQYYLSMPNAFDNDSNEAPLALLHSIENARRGQSQRADESKESKE